MRERLLKRTVKYCKESMMDRRLSFEVRPSQLMISTLLLAIRDIEREDRVDLLNINMYNKAAQLFIYPEDTIVKIGERVSGLVADMEKM